MRKSTEQSLNSGGTLYRGMGGTLCRETTGLHSRGMSGTLCAESPPMAWL